MIELGNFLLNYSLILYILQCQLILTSLLVIIVRHPIHSILALVLVFIETGFFLLFLSIDYLGNLLMIVYVGAVAILFLFVVMMLNIRLIILNISVLSYLPLSFFLCLCIWVQQLSIFKHLSNIDLTFQALVSIKKFFYLNLLNYQTNHQFSLYLFFKYKQDASFDLSFSYNQIDYLYYINLFDIFYSLRSIETFAYCLYNYTYLPFLASSIVLLVAMIGSISLTLYHSIGVKRQVISKQILREFVPNLTY